MKNVLFCSSVLCTGLLFGESIAPFCNNDIPLKRVTLYSSGVAQYEHSGTISGSGSIHLLFSAEQINDVLKSLIVCDSAAQKVSIDYQTGNTAEKALESLTVNPAAANSLFTFLQSQCGAEIEVYTPNKITGKIVGVEPYFDSAGAKTSSGTAKLSLLSEGKIHILPFSDIQSFRFTDEQRNTDLNTALHIILHTAIENRKQLSIHIEGEKTREISLSYVMESPVWKASYRLDAAKDEAALQAWAIVDNASDLDWNNITLTLTTGKPVAFKQNLYEPYYTDRPTLPLLIAQTAEPAAFESGYAAAPMDEAQALGYSGMKSSAMARCGMNNSRSALEAEARAIPEKSYFDNQVIAGDSEGSLCTFTPVQPVALERQKSTMIPLVLASIPAEKVSVFSSFDDGRTTHPKYCISLRNTSGYTLPAGPVTVFDNGRYVGDAVLHFLPDGEKRLIAYGDDIEVRGTMYTKSDQNIESVKIVGGTMNIFSKRVKKTQYTVKNASGTIRTIIIEHPICNGFKLVTEKKMIEKTAQQYRFQFKIAAGAEETYTIQEERVSQQVQGLLTANDDFFVSLAANDSLSAEAQNIFKTIVKERQKLSDAREALKNLQHTLAKRSAEQERTRKNLEAFGKETQQGREFITKLLTLESELEDLTQKIDTAEQKLRTAEADFSAYLSRITL